MSRVLKKFISILEKKIALLTKEIDKQRESLNIESYTNLFTEENIWNLTKEDLDNLLKFDVLNEEEQELYKLRVIKQLSQREIANKLGVDQSTISRKLKKLKVEIKKGM